MNFGDKVKFDKASDKNYRGRTGLIVASKYKGDALKLQVHWTRCERTNSNLDVKTWVDAKTISQI